MKSLVNQTKKASTLYLSKEASTKDQHLKVQMMMTLTDDDSRKSETVWKENRFFKEHRTDLPISTPNFPENILCCVYQGSISPIKGEQGIHLEFVIIGHILSLSNPDPKIALAHYDFKDNDKLRISFVVCSFL